MLSEINCKEYAIASMRKDTFYAILGGIYASCLLKRVRCWGECVSYHALQISKFELITP